MTIFFDSSSLKNLRKFPNDNWARIGNTQASSNFTEFSFLFGLPCDQSKSFFDQICNRKLDFAELYLERDEFSFGKWESGIFFDIEGFERLNIYVEADKIERVFSSLKLKIESIDITKKLFSLRITKNYNPEKIIDMINGLARPVKL